MSSGFPNHIQLDTPQSVSILWMKDRPSQRPLPDKHTQNTRNRQTSMPQVGIEPTVSPSYRPLTLALDRSANGIGIYLTRPVKHLPKLLQLQYCVLILSFKQIPCLYSPFLALYHHVAVTPGYLTY